MAALMAASISLSDASYRVLKRPTISSAVAPAVIAFHKSTPERCRQ